MTMVVIMNKKQISKSEFKAKALDFFRQVESSGTPLIITDHGKPTIEICPYHAIEKSPLEILKGSVTEYTEPTEPVGVDDWKALV